VQLPNSAAEHSVGELASDPVHEPGSHAPPLNEPSAPQTWSPLAL